MSEPLPQRSHGVPDVGRHTRFHRPIPHPFAAPHSVLSFIREFGVFCPVTGPLPAVPLDFEMSTTLGPGRLWYVSNMLSLPNLPVYPRDLALPHLAAEASPGSRAIVTTVLTQSRYSVCCLNQRIAYTPYPLHQPIGPFWYKCETSASILPAAAVPHIPPQVGPSPVVGHGPHPCPVWTVLEVRGS